MGSKLSCSLRPRSRSKRRGSARRGHEPKAQEGAVAGSPTSLEPKQDVGGGEQQRAQQVIGLQMPREQDSRKTNVTHIKNRENNRPGLETSGGVPSRKCADSKAVKLTPVCRTLPHPSHCCTPDTSSNRCPLAPPKAPKAGTLIFRSACPFQPRAPLCYREDLRKSGKTTINLLPTYRPEQESSDEELELSRSPAALQRDLRILEAAGARHTGAQAWPTRRLSSWGESAPRVLLPEAKRGAQTATEERRLGDVLCAVKAEVQELRKNSEKIMKFLEEGQRVLRDIEELLRRGMKNPSPSQDKTDAE